MTYTRTAMAAALAATLTATLAAGTAIAAERAPAAQTRAEAQTRAAEMFARMDVNKDGKIDAADRAARQTSMFEAVDVNKDGQISREEFAAHHAMPHHGEGHQGRRMGGHDGKPHGEGRMRGEHRMGSGMMGQMADANGDKAISQQEFTAAALRRFDSVDTNKDGTITREERRAARGAMRERMRHMNHATPST